MPINPVTALDSVAHVIQVALTPVFLLSGIAALLGVFATRLARVADRVDQIVARLADCGDEDAAFLLRQLQFLRRRSLTLDVAVLVAAVGGVATCGSILTLFIGAVRDAAVAWTLFSLFGTGVLCTIGALIAFVTEMLMAGRGLRVEVDRQRMVGLGWLP